MFDVIKSNLEMATRLNDKVLFDIVLKQLTVEMYAQFTDSQAVEMLTLVTDSRVRLLAQTNPKTVQPAPNLPKACAFSDPTCESCSA